MNLRAMSVWTDSMSGFDDSATVGYLHNKCRWLAVSAARQKFFNPRHEIQGLHAAFKKAKITLGLLEESAASCHTCQIIHSGITGCIEKHGMRPFDVVDFDFNFGYCFYDRDIGERDTRKLITLRLQSGEEFMVEFFTLEGLMCLYIANIKC